LLASLQEGASDDPALLYDQDDRAFGPGEEHADAAVGRAYVRIVRLAAKEWVLSRVTLVLFAE
jgi:hypothetical protein